MQIIDQIRQLIANLDVVAIAAWGYWSYIILAVAVAIEGPIATLLGAAAASLGLMQPDLRYRVVLLGLYREDRMDQAFR
jgi:hypothetical protein